jgi:NADH-quinone oxidoreductase subunit G
MPKPTRNFITFEIDGREVSAPEGDMLVDAAKYGDVEIPYFCYEPKLGAPVGACRMCLVEIEGIPKLQTGCSTPVRDGMVVNTKSDRVQQAQNAIVEFLLINHPLDCPVCDKGGECPLQDISYGWGAGRSRFIDPKRHFKKPLELSPLIAIDRERCILCYRCVRFSQEISEDEQLVLLERGDHTFVGTHDAHPYVDRFSGNIVELCPVGALTSTAYRFRARPWDVEDSGSVCTFCPSQCNIKFTVRDDAKVMRVLARDNDRVDDGWLCDKGRFGYEIVHSPERILEPMVRDGGFLRQVSWERAISDAVSGLARFGASTAALVGGETTNEEGYLTQRLVREALGSSHIDSRAGAVLDSAQATTLGTPQLSVATDDIDHAGAVLVIGCDLVEDSPILDLRVRKAARRNGAKVVCASTRPTGLDRNASSVLRFAPSGSEALLGSLALALTEQTGRSPSHVGCDDLAELARRAGTSVDDLRSSAQLLADSGPVVILWSERLSHGPRSTQTVASLLAVCEALGVAETDDSGLIEIPQGTNARGLREVGCVPNLGVGLTELDNPGKSSSEIADSVGTDLGALLLLHCDPVRTYPDRAAWQRALAAAGLVVCFSDFVTESVEQYADVVFPAESYAEKEGTLTHPDGRLQRLRQAIGRSGSVRPEWVVLCELLEAVSGVDPGIDSNPAVTDRLCQEVSFYRGLSLSEIGGQGVRWQEREEATSLDWPKRSFGAVELAPEPDNGFELATAPSLWTGRETKHAPSLRFLEPTQTVELSAADGARLDISTGDEVEVRSNGTKIRARASLRDELPQRCVFLLEGTNADTATALTNGATPTVEVTKT